LTAAPAQAAGHDVDVAARHSHQQRAAEKLNCGEPDGEYDVVIELREANPASAVLLQQPVAGVVSCPPVFTGTLAESPGVHAGDECIARLL
jgi:hypothetical protein